MGCGGSKDSKKDKEISGEFKKTNIGALDDIFSQAGEVLETCEKIRAGTEDAKDDGLEGSHCYKLVEPKYLDVVQVLIWALSAEGKGKIKDVGLNATSSAPFLVLDGHKCMYETMKLYESFTTYVTTMVSAPGDLQKAIETLTEISGKVPDAVKSAQDEIKGGSLGFKEKADALMAIGKNSAKLPKEIAKAKNLLTLIKEGAADLKETTPKIPDLIKKADEVGAKCAKAEILRLSDVFAHLPGERKPEYKNPDGSDKKDPPKKEEPKKDGKKEEKKDEKKPAPAAAKK